MAAGAGLACAAAAEPVGNRPQSLVLGDWIESRIVGSARCSDDPQAICTDALVEARIVVVATVAGRRVPSPLSVRFIAHVPPRRGERRWLVVARGHPRRAWPAFLVDGTGAERDREICVSREEMRLFGGAPPDGGEARGDDVCYRP